MLHKPDIKISNPVAKNMRSLLNERPDEGVVFRCLQCQTWLLPSEVHTLRIHDKETGFDIRMLCPVCHPNANAYQGLDEEILNSPLMRFTREECLYVIQMEELGWHPEEKLIEVVS